MIEVVPRQRPDSVRRQELRLLRHGAGALLIQVTARHGIDHGTELPDHLCWLLRLVAAAPDDPELADLRTQLMLPAVRVLHERVRSHQNPYPPLVHALYLELGGEEIPT